MLTFRFVHVPDLVTTLGLTFNQDTNEIRNMLISDHSNSIIWGCATDCLLINFLEKGNIDVSSFETRIIQAQYLWHHGGLAKEFQYVLTKYTNPDPILGRVQPGSWITLEQEQTNVVCTGFKLIFELEDDKEIITRQGISVPTATALEILLIREIEVNAKANKEKACVV